MKGAKLRVDSRNLQYHKVFGAAISIPDEMDFDSGLTNIIEAPGAVDCTALTGTDTCTDQTKVVYDDADLWNLTPHDAYGATPQDSLGTIVKQGLLPKGGVNRDTRWKSYYQIDVHDQLDYFDSVRLGMLQTNSSAFLATNWYSNWAVAANSVLPMPDYTVSGHAYKACGWKGDMMKIKPWEGFFLWMPRDVFNKTLDAWGTGAYIPLTEENSKQIQISILRRILDALLNIGLIFKQWTQYLR